MPPPPKQPLVQSKGSVDSNGNASGVWASDASEEDTAPTFSAMVQQKDYSNLSDSITVSQKSGDTTVTSTSSRAPSLAESVGGFDPAKLEMQHKQATVSFWYSFLRAPSRW